MGKWTDQEVKLLTKLYPKTIDWDTLLTALPKYTKRAIQTKALEKKLRKPRQIYSKTVVNENLFSIWNERTAYLLGFIEADGYIIENKDSVTICIFLSKKDNVFLKEIASLLTYKGKISTKLHQNKYRTVGFQCTSRQWKVDLYNKLRIGKIPDCITKELLPHYIRGYFDGDGTIYFEGQSKSYKAGFVFATHKLAKSITSVTHNIAGSKSKIYKINGKRCWYITYSRNMTMKLCNFMYQNSTYHLKRKYNKYQQARR